MSAVSAARLALARHLLESERPAGPVPGVVVAIPARDEEARIDACLASLIAQRGIPAAHADVGIVLVANNCRDATAPRARHLLRKSGIPHRVLALDLPAGNANAGHARGLALDVAGLWAGQAGGRGILLTTDADTRVGPDWIARNIAALSGCCDAVAGRFVFDRREEAAWPPHLRRRRRLEGAYEHALAALSTCIDPLPEDPWPNHWTESGASFAVTLAAYRRIGGLPVVEVGEDRALAATLARHDIALRHDPGIVVTTSARFDGRADGGCASTLRLRAERDAVPADERLEPLPAALRRMVLRGRMRRAFAANCHPGTWERRLALPEGALGGRTGRSFGEAWATALAQSPLLVPEPLRPDRIADHLRDARRLRGALEGLSPGSEKIEAIVVGALPGKAPVAAAERADELVGGCVA
ncbi:glycosyltransferase family A protein [Methylobrevis pamukkalensis]|uniref:Glycosyl transferase family 2 n=1 Tax=Methylobrevis pamukkalensis TaxID=1439726 RepID=A0A1E3H6F0_9HYPH|nr:glycosyltransferase family A protein [Methylobrevis pamukkalensis]ODN71893.1 Glycosyl transferase family 2 [Methylobrevis pamukkalensis]